MLADPLARRPSNSLSFLPPPTPPRSTTAGCHDGDSLSMSGVFGIVTPRRAAQIRELAGRMTASLSHRAGVVCEAYIDDGRGLAIGRTGIGVFNHGPQPVWNHDRTVAVVLSGELYGAGGPERNGQDRSDEERGLGAD